MTTNAQFLAPHAREAIDELIALLQEFINSDPDMLRENPSVYLDAQKQIMELTSERIRK
jgi:hypothetical protein